MTTDPTMIEIERRILQIEDQLRLLREFISNEQGASGPRKHVSSPAEMEKMMFYQEEVINKCGGKIPMSEHPKRALFAAVAKEVPRFIINESLMAMQDARLRNLDPDNPNPVKDLLQYYFACVRNGCTKNNISLSFEL